MNDISDERPDFFEGEYLSASDLEQLVVYLRNQSARHNLGGHAWGIASGLQIVEQALSGGDVDLYLLPGYAVDGYGRHVVVLNPLRLGVNDFSGQPSGLVRVWLRYDQGTTSAVKPGFEVCNAGDSYSRIAESYALVVGNRTFSQTTDGITVSGEAVDDPRAALRVFDDAGPVECDASVPFQDLPLADERSQWLIPLGVVRWQTGTPGRFRALVSPTETLYARRLRRYLGVVAENVLAADGVIRLRGRTVPVPSGQTVDSDFIDGFCGPGDLSDDAHVDDLQVCDDQLAFNELVWVEGRLRVTDDVRILGGRLEIKDAAGTDYLPTPNNAKVIAPLFLQRTETNDPANPNSADTADLEINIGKADKGHNRVLVQQVSGGTADAEKCGRVMFAADQTKILLSVVDSGHVGIGTGDPDQLLEIASGDSAFIHLQDTAAPSDLYVGAGAFGGVLAAMGTNDLRFRTGGVDDPTDDEDTRMIIDAKGRVGMGTTEPHDKRVLTLEDSGAAWMIARNKTDQTDPNSPDPHEILVGVDSDGARVSANIEGDDLILGADGNEPIVWVKASGRVGINEDKPGYDLSVKGNSKSELSLHTSGNKRLLLGADGDGTKIGSTGADDLLIKTNDTLRMIVKSDGKVGVGTDDPVEKLDVRGHIKLGSGGNLYAPGSPDNWRIVAGAVSGSGSGSLGSGFTSVKVGDYYYITYSTVFPHAPVVTVTGTNGNHDGIPLPPSQYQWPVVTFSDENGFHVLFINAAGVSPVEEKFSFIVFGER